MELKNFQQWLGHRFSQQFKNSSPVLAVLQTQVGAGEPVVFFLLYHYQA